MGSRRTPLIRRIINFVFFIAVPLLIAAGIFLANYANKGFELDKNSDRLDQFFGEDNWQVVHHNVVEREEKDDSDEASDNATVRVFYDVWTISYQTAYGEQRDVKFTSEKSVAQNFYDAALDCATGEAVHDLNGVLRNGYNPDIDAYVMINVFSAEEDSAFANFYYKKMTDKSSFNVQNADLRTLLTNCNDLYLSINTGFSDTSQADSVDDMKAILDRNKEAEEVLKDKLGDAATFVITFNLDKETYGRMKDAGQPLESDYTQYNQQVDYYKGQKLDPDVSVLHLVQVNSQSKFERAWNEIFS